MFKIMTIPFDRIQKGFDDEILNKFLLNKKLKSYRAAFFQDRDEKYWTLLVEYDPVLLVPNPAAGGTSLGTQLPGSSSFHPGKGLNLANPLQTPQQRPATHLFCHINNRGMDTHLYPERSL